MNSKFLSLASSDFVKGLILVVFYAVLDVIYTAFNTKGKIEASDWTQVGVTSALVGIAYLKKNLFTNSEGAPLSPESK